MNHQASQNIFIFIGPPGAGKGSLAHLCTKRFGWMQVSTGNLCRKHIAEETEIGKEIDLIIKSGKLISDDTITSMVVEWLTENGHKTPGVIFDGYPRTVAQAEAFSRILAQVFPNVSERVVLFLIPDDVVVNRLCRRFVCQNTDCQAIYSLDSNTPHSMMICNLCGSALGRRGDDEESAVKKRLSVYHKHEQELLAFYKNNSTEILELDAAKPLQEVFKLFLQTLDEEV